MLLGSALEGAAAALPALLDNSKAQLHPDRAIQLLDRCSALADRLVPELRLPDGVPGAVHWWLAPLTQLAVTCFELSSQHPGLFTPERCLAAFAPAWNAVDKLGPHIFEGKYSYTDEQLPVDDVAVSASLFGMLEDIWKKWRDQTPSGVRMRRRLRDVRTPKFTSVQRKAREQFERIYAGAERSLFQAIQRPSGKPGVGPPAPVDEHDVIRWLVTYSGVPWPLLGKRPPVDAVCSKLHSLLVASPPLEWACNPSQFSPHLAGFPFADGDSAIFRIFLFYAGSRLMPPSLAAYIHLLVSPPSQYGPVPHALHALRRVPYLPPSLKEQGWFCSAVAHLLTVTMAAGEAHGAKLADEVMPILMRMNRQETAKHLAQAVLATVQCGVDVLPLLQQLPACLPSRKLLGAAQFGAAVGFAQREDRAALRSFFELPPLPSVRHSVLVELLRQSDWARAVAYARAAGEAGQPLPAKLLEAAGSSLYAAKQCAEVVALAELAPDSEELWILAVLSTAVLGQVEAAMQLAAEGGPAGVGGSLRQQGSWPAGYTWAAGGSGLAAATVG
ncbi:DNA mismatch repair [Micractinium conductrix]|uniref:DNA mismatch repair n=1 Tax=Micractinium conductrix TaxID=554055 RepID=A0A2P6VMP8_9CHLO|nr:DNA mismatch repair [Micractinium conductrix]|eukprot:PSC75381.1 DNA mismatch repair [Micractinium conductrix]